MSLTQAAICATHPEAAATGVCERCGDFICAGCSRPCEGRLYCQNCFRIIYQRGGFALNRRAFVEGWLALVFAVFSLSVAFIPTGFIFFLPYAVGLVILSWAHLHAEPELPRWHVITATVVTLLAAAGSILSFLYSYWK